ncbi:chalcone isomerase family protein [Chitinimonas koreensis]|uniref:chalcone isomerase family protein n=1 Tax=Chitinimonas koreensis TaxID=356302 RepID=UPI0003FEF3CD|nr:chalcone isomerase family protein [Chitinimonas koreensis]
MWRAACLALLLMGPAGASTWQALLPQARIVGQGEFRWFGFRIYEASLWSEAGEVSPARPFALQLRYLTAIGREQFVERSIAEIEHLHPELPRDQLHTTWRGWMRQAFVDVSSGDTLTGVYLPGRGARFFFGDRQTAAIDDDAFARAFFDIWLSPNTRAPSLRKALLGGAR